MHYHIFKYILLHFIFTLQVNEIISITTHATTESPKDLTEIIDVKNTTNQLQPVAEQLIQEYHHHHQHHYPQNSQRQSLVNSIKYTRPKNRVTHKRMKKPKVKVSFAEPPHTTIKPIWQIDSKSPTEYTSNTYPNVHFNLPTSVTYDTQNFNVEFYDGYESNAKTNYYDADDDYNDHLSEANEKYKEILMPSVLSSLDMSKNNFNLHSPDISSYLYEEGMQPQTASALRKPHTEYGIPKKHSKHSRRPAIKYGVPVHHHHFAEPPSLNFDLPHSYRTKTVKKPTHKYTPPEKTIKNPYRTEPVQSYDYTPHHKHESPKQQLKPSDVQTTGYVIPSSNDLPISQEDKIAPYDYPKTSYEVPLYDPAPFDADKHEKFEIYPPHIPLQQSIQTPQSETDSHYSSSSFNINESPSGDLPSIPNYYFRAYKRPKNSTQEVAPTIRTYLLGNKHILDTPELKKAFEDSQRTKLPASMYLDGETQTASSSSIKVGMLKSEVWNPVKIRPSPSKQTSTVATIALPSNKNRYQNYNRRRTTSTEKPPSITDENKVEISALNTQSQLDTIQSDVLSTPKSLTIKTVPTSNHYRYRQLLKQSNSDANNKSIVPHATNLNDSYKLPQRSTKRVLDITPFKSPYSNRNFTMQLPQNHKMF